LENWIIDNTTSAGQCVFPPLWFARLIVYLKGYGGGGPNARVRKACLPALQRIGIIVMPKWKEK
jgi:hypothetical protein